MTKVRPKKPDDTAIIKFKNEKERKYFTLMLLDVILLCAIIVVIPSIFLSIVLSLGIIYLLTKHFKGYHLANKEDGDKA